MRFLVSNLPETSSLTWLRIPPHFRRATNVLILLDTNWAQVAKALGTAASAEQLEGLNSYAKDWVAAYRNWHVGMLEI